MASIVAQAFREHGWDVSNSHGACLTRSLIESPSIKQALIATAWGTLLTQGAEINTWGNSLRARLCFLETAMIAAAETVTNVALAILLVAPALFTAGALNGEIKCHAIRAGLGLMMAIYGLAGAILPKVTPFTVGGGIGMGIAYLGANAFLKDIQQLAQIWDVKKETELFSTSENCLVGALNKHLSFAKVQDWTSTRKIIAQVFRDAQHFFFRGVQK